MLYIRQNLHGLPQTRHFNQMHKVYTTSPDARHTEIYELMANLFVGETHIMENDASDKSATSPYVSSWIQASRQT